jgi:hypothetical protein
VVGSKPGKPRLTSVTILSLKQKGAEIKGELSPGQWVVTAGATSIDKNQEVRLFKEPSKTNIGKEM